MGKTDQQINQIVLYSFVRWIILTVFLGRTVVGHCNNLTSEYDVRIIAYRECLDRIQDQNDIDSLTDIKKKWLSLADLYPNDYLIGYYLAEVDWSICSYYHEHAQYVKFQESFSSGLKYIDQSIALNDKFVDALLLQNQYLGYKIFVDGWKLTNFDQGIINQNIKKAQELSSNHPNIYLIKGINDFYVPEAYGGSLSEAKLNFHRAIELAAIYEPARCTYPVVHIESAYIYLAKIAELENKRDSALSFYNNAIHIAPESTWVQQEYNQFIQAPHAKTQSTVILVVLFLSSAVAIALVFKHIKKKTE